MVQYSQRAETAAATTADRSNLVLLILCSAAFTAMLDVFVVNIAFTAIGAAYTGSSLADLSWILNAYTIVYAALLIPAGRLADRYGRKAGFLGGLAVFTLASAVCAASPTLGVLIAARVLQAAGAAALTPASLGLLLTAMPAAERAYAVKVWATSTSVAAALGPVLGGALVQLSWQWVFLVNVPIGVAALLAAIRFVPDSRDESVTAIPDVLGALVLAVALGATALALVQGPEWGWSGPGLPTAVAVAALGTAAIVIRVFRHPVPIVAPALLRVRTFSSANCTALLFCTAFGAVLPSVVLWLEGRAGFSALRTGWAIAPGPLMVPIFAAVSQQLLRRWSSGMVVAFGNLLVGVGAAMLALSADTEVDYATQVLPGWIVVGIGVGFALPTLLATATVGLPAAWVATGSAVVNTSRQLGYVLGVSLLVAVLGSTAVPAERAETVFTRAWWVIAAVAAVAALTSFGITEKRNSE
ncbi:MFS transporter [Nocardia sp. 2]|uniref:MFS transporter n=1 Tax=Nocardia acididurans TaxID=2802282 RepID=A0ABS1M200_9NOCA|nr:MFS transporter [Nocardia acididurans]MBL1074682.1 MFS transporter [Nocardia acididurans]